MIEYTANAKRCDDVLRRIPSGLDTLYAHFFRDIRLAVDMIDMGVKKVQGEHLGILDTNEISFVMNLVE